MNKVKIYTYHENIRIFRYMYLYIRISSSHFFFFFWLISVFLLPNTHDKLNFILSNDEKKYTRVTEIYNIIITIYYTARHIF